MGAVFMLELKQVTFSVCRKLDVGFSKIRKKRLMRRERSFPPEQEERVFPTPHSKVHVCYFGLHYFLRDLVVTSVQKENENVLSSVQPAREIS